MALLCKINVCIITMIIKITVIVITVMIVKPHNFVEEKKLWNKYSKFIGHTICVLKWQTK